MLIVSASLQAVCIALLCTSLIDHLLNHVLQSLQAEGKSVDVVQIV
jgi:hypothetical protein